MIKYELICYYGNNATINCSGITLTTMEGVVGKIPIYIYMSATIKLMFWLAMASNMLHQK